MLDPNRHVATNPQQQYVCEEGASKNMIKNVLIQLTEFMIVVSQFFLNVSDYKSRQTSRNNKYFTT